MGVSHLLSLSVLAGAAALSCNASNGGGQGADLSSGPPDLAEADLSGTSEDLLNSPIDLTGVVSNGLTVSTLSTGSFKLPVGIAVDTKGPFLWVADMVDQTVQKLDAASGRVVMTIGVSGMSGFVNGSIGVAKFRFPIGVQVDAQGNVYVADSQNHAIRKITFTNGQPDVSTFSGGTRGNMDGTGTAAKFNLPGGVEVDAMGNVYVADTLNCALRQVTPAGVTSTLFSPGCLGMNIIYQAIAVIRDGNGVVYTSAPPDHRLMQTTFMAGMGRAVVYAGSSAVVGMSGYRDGPAAQALFNVPYGLAFDPKGNIVVADQENHRIRRVLVGANPKVETVAGIAAGAVDGDALLQARFNGPRGVAADASGVIYVADTGNKSIRKIK